MKIGIGLTRYGRPEHFKLFKRQLEATKYTGAFHVADDSENRMGIAYRKNECLRALRDCDYIFLYDDDTFPIKAGWVDFFIAAHKASGQHHFLYLKETPTIKNIKTERTAMNPPKFDINIYNNCGGAFMFLTKEVIEKVGAFSSQFGYYGFEHADYSDRIHEAGLTPMGKYLCPAGAGEYIYALDYDNHLSFNKDVDHKPSMPIAETIKHINKAREVYLQKDKTIFLPL